MSGSVGWGRCGNPRNSKVKLKIRGRRNFDTRKLGFSLDFFAPPKPYDRAFARRRSITVAFVLSGLIHAAVLGLWLIKKPVIVNIHVAGHEKELNVSLAPLSTPPERQARVPPPSPPVSKPAPPTPPPPARPAARKSRGRTKNHAQVEKPVIAVETPSAAGSESAPVTPLQSQITQASPPPSNDMFTQLQEKREERTKADAQEHALQAASVPSPESDAQHANDIALANIKAQRRSMGVDEDDTGGVFQIRYISLHYAEFFFHGWNQDFRRDWSQLVTVEQGSNDNIQIAVIKKMIGIIRAYKQDDFVWDSRRLGRHVTLSARPEDDAALQRFLMREFFPGMKVVNQPH